MKLVGKITDQGFRVVSGDRFVVGHHKIPRIWVVIADRHSARIFIKSDGHLEEIGVATPSSHERPKSVLNHSSGRVVCPVSGVIYYKLMPHVLFEEKKPMSFTHDIAAWLEEAAREDVFDRIVLVAAPRMLARLNDVHPDMTEETVFAVLGHGKEDLVRLERD